MLRAAWYYYKDELTQDEIARRLSMSRASVGRLLDRARRVGLVSINLNTEYLDAFELSGELCRRSVIPSPIMASTADLAAALRAEPTIQQVLKQACGVEYALVGVAPRQPTRPSSTRAT